jgi:ketosteroid isomerase-like protein
VSERDRRAIVGEVYDAYARRDFERVAALMHDDIDWVIYAPMSVFPFAGARRGRAAVLEAMGSIATDFILDSYVPEVIIVDGERAAVMSDVRFTQRSTQRTLRFRVADLLRMRDGKLIEFREFLNTFDAVEQTLGRQLQVG